MDLKNKHFWSEAFHCIGITVFTILLTVLMVYGLPLLSVFSPLEKSADFQMSDLYQSVARSNRKYLSPDITVVSIDGCSRAEVLDAVERIEACYPAAIGLDVTFEYPENDNTRLLSTLENQSDLVCAAKFEKDEQDDTWHHAKQSFYEDSINATYGYVNLNTFSRWDVVRSFRPFVMTSNGDTLLSMPAQLAKMYNPKSYNDLLARNKKEETIAFENIEFWRFSAREVLAKEVDESLLSERIILVGDTGNIKDSYLSPLHDPISGVMLHAYALQTILDGNYIDTTQKWLNWLIAIVLCILLTSCNLWAGYRRSIFVRIAQFVIIYLLIVIGCVYFDLHHTYIDFSLSILMIAFGLVAFDIWFGFVALYNFIKNKISKK